MSDARIFVQEVLPTLAVQRKQTVNFEEKNDPLEFTSTFIQDRKYFVGDTVKLSFKFVDYNHLWKNVARKALLEKYDFLELRAEDDETDLFVRADVAEQVEADQRSKPVSERWYFEAIGIPEYAAGANGLGEGGTVFCADLTGKSSYFEYTCNPETELFEIYVNISMTDEEAKQI